VGELDLDQIERLLGPESEKERPQEKQHVIREQSLVDETAPSQRDDDERLAIARK
jgi:hypothetical protein